ncbi:MAG: hypothetical protein KGL02_05930 [Acidobacteriota bacterium]|nr:hypothetical protein [Acidobacteriota bacterium]
MQPSFSARFVLLFAIAIFACVGSNSLFAASAFGPIRLQVDATQAPQKILRARMQMPVPPAGFLRKTPVAVDRVAARHADSDRPPLQPDLHLVSGVRIRHG